jgi:hypothetical protein
VPVATAASAFGVRLMYLVADLMAAMGGMAAMWCLFVIRRSGTLER